MPSDQKNRSSIIQSFDRRLKNEYQKVELSDAAQVAEIYNYYILKTHHTFETEALSADEMRERIVETSADYPYLVAEFEGEIQGYVYATQFKLRQAYKHSVEASIYVRNGAKQKGIGSQLYEVFSKNCGKPTFTRLWREFLCRTRQASSFTKNSATKKSRTLRKWATNWADGVGRWFLGNAE